VTGGHGGAGEGRHHVVDRQDAAIAGDAGVLESHAIDVAALALDRDVAATRVELRIQRDDAAGFGLPHHVNVLCGMPKFAPPDSGGAG